MRIDPREIYIKRLLTLDRSTNRSFRDFFYLALLILEEPDGKENTDVEKAEDLLFFFLSQFKTEKGLPSIESILFELDNMRVLNKKYLLIKTRQTRKKFTYTEVIIMLQNLEDEIMLMIRKKAKNIRILNPDIQA